MCQTASRTFTILGHVVTVHGVEMAETLADRLDILLGPGDTDSQGQANHHTVITLRREGSKWHLSDEHGADACSPLRNEERVAYYVEWLAYCAAIRQATMPLVLHAGAVSRAGGAVVLPNASGAGKTTLTLALAARGGGWLPLTDDVCPLVERAGDLVATGCARCCHLTPSSLAILRAHGVDLDGPVGGLPTYYRPRRWGEPAPVRAIVIPRYRADAPTSLVAITQAECLAQLASMNFAQVAPPAHERRRTAARLAARVPAFALTYSDLDEAIDAFGTLEARLDARHWTDARP